MATPTTSSKTVYSTSGFVVSNTDSEITGTFATGVKRDMDERTSMHGVKGEDALRALMMVEISEDAEEAESLRRARQQTVEGGVRWLADDESTEDATTDSD